MNFSTNPPMNAFVKNEPPLEGNWICLRFQRASFGPFFEWVNTDDISVQPGDCKHCEGEGELELVSAANASTDVECPWCEGTGETEHAHSLSEDAARRARSERLTIWCDTDGNIIEPDLTLHGWIKDAWLLRFEPKPPIAHRPLRIIFVAS
ncbi:MAG: hypothetical protein JWM78_1631 [Verrucomicrobiaceae bacterium]|nr:hypothetical protein [Verrucomicrobiaceae bacterium]